MKLKYLFLLITFQSSIHSGISQSLSIQETMDYLNNILVQCPHKKHIKSPVKSDKTNSFNEDNIMLDNNRIALNKAEFLYPGCDVVSTINVSLDKEGYLTFKTIFTLTNCDDKLNNVSNETRITSRINISDIDLNRTTWHIPTSQIIDGEMPATGWELNDNVYDQGSIALYCNADDEKCISFDNLIPERTSFENSHKDFIYQKQSKKSSCLITIYSNNIKYDVKRFYNALFYLISSAKEQGYKKVISDKNDPFVSPSSIANTNDAKPTKAINEYKATLKKEGGVFSLTVNISGVTSQFVLDSGAGETSFSSTLESKLLANGIIKQSDYLKNGLYRLADGSIVECKRVKIPKITVGGKTIYNVIAAIGPTGSPNLLGQSFLNKTNMWSIDNERNILIMR